MCLTRFVQYFMHRINLFVASNLDKPGYEPNIDEFASDLIKLAFMNAVCLFFIPVGF